MAAIFYDQVEKHCLMALRVQQLQNQPCQACHNFTVIIVFFTLGKNSIPQERALRFVLGRAGQCIWVNFVILLTKKNINLF